VLCDPPEDPTSHGGAVGSVWSGVMAEHLDIHVIADSSGETAARIARAAQAQFPGVEMEIVRHPRITSTKKLLEAFDVLRAKAGERICVLYTLVSVEKRDLVERACAELGIPHADLMGPPMRALEEASGSLADRVPARPVGVEADYFVRIAAMEFAIRNDDGAIPQALRDCDIALVGASRSGKTPLSIYLGYLGYRTVNVPLVKGIAPPTELMGMPRWRIVGLTIDPERLLAIRNQRVRGMGGFGTKDGYADLAGIFDELDEVSAVQRKLGCPIVDTTRLALEEAAVRVIELVDRRARSVGETLRRPAGSLQINP